MKSMKPHARRPFAPGRQRFSRQVRLSAVALFAAALVSSGALDAAAQQPVELKLMTWNVCGVSPHCHNEGGMNGMSIYSAVIGAREVNPDVIALQEVTLAQAINITYALGHFTWQDIYNHLQFVQAKKFPARPGLVERLPVNFPASYFGDVFSPLGGKPSDFGSAIITLRHPIVSATRRQIRYTEARLVPPDHRGPEAEKPVVAVAGILVQGKLVVVYDMHTARPAAGTQADIDVATNQMNQLHTQLAFDSYVDGYGKPPGYFRPVLMGDFNMDQAREPQAAQPFRALARDRFIDAWAIWKWAHPGSPDTGLTLVNKSVRYDYIFFDRSSNVEVKHVRALNNPPQLITEYPSIAWNMFRLQQYQMMDHYPVLARLVFK